MDAVRVRDGSMTNVGGDAHIAPYEKMQVLNEHLHFSVCQKTTQTPLFLL